MESQQPVSPTSSKPGNRNVIILVVAAVLLCCCLLVVAIGGYYAYQAYQATAQTFNDFAPDIPDLSQPPTTSPSVETFSNDLPQGGLTDDTLRNDTWQYVGIAALAQDCAAEASTTSIEVTQDPDVNGFWVEKWTVSCPDGSTKAFDVSFTPDPNGGTSLSVTPSQ